MRWLIIKTIFVKELLETVRDRRTLFIMLFLPVVLYPMLLVGFSQVVSHQIAKWQATPGRIMIVGKVPLDLRSRLEADKGIELIDCKEPPPLPASFPVIKKSGKKTDLRKGLMNKQKYSEKLKYDEALKKWASEIISDGKAEVVFLAPQNFAENITHDITGTAVVFYNETDERSSALYNRFWDMLFSYRDELLDTRRQAYPNLKTGVFRPLFVEGANVASAKSRGGYFAGRFLPMMIMIMVMLGAFYPAVDLTAGEKERGTMETLLTAPAYATEIIFGKFLAVSTISITSALVNLGSMALAIFYLLQSSNMGGQLNFHLPPSTGLIIFLQLIPVAVFFSSSMLAVAVLARSFKEAQNYLTPLYLLVVIPVTLSALPGTELTMGSAWVPVVNITMLMKEMLVTPPELSIIAMVLAANTVYSIITLLIAVKIFQNENILLGGKVSVKDVMGVSKPGSRPSPAFAIVLFASLLVLFFYVGSYLQKQDIFKGLMASQYLLLLVPTIAVVYACKMDFKAVFSIRRPMVRDIATAALLGAGSWVFLSMVAGWLQNQILPVPPEIEKAMTEMLKLNDPGTTTWLLLLAIAVTPAICEEFLFRGAIMDGFRQGMGKWPAVLLTAVCFGVFHISIYRMLPTAIIGLVATLLVWESRSIFTGMLFHFLHNGLTVYFARQKDYQSLLDSKSENFNALLFYGLGVAFITGLILLFLPRKNLGKS